MVSAARGTSVNSSTSNSSSMNSSHHHFVPAYEDAPSPSSNPDETEDVYQSIVKNRKSWKTARSGEVVWPPELEQALLEGLKKYKPDDCRETRLLGRFPMRNRHISNYIFSKTKQKRTPKQVGSRLQQLRDTCNGNGLMNLLSPCRKQAGPSSTRTYEFLKENTPPVMRGTSSAMSDYDTASEASMPPTPTDYQFPRHATDEQPTSPAHTQTVVYIDILPESVNSPSAGSKPLPPLSSDVLSSSEVEETNAICISPEPRSLRAIDPTIAFITQADVSAQSHFTIFFDQLPFRSGTSPLEAVEALPGIPAGSVLYRTSIVPEFWQILCDSPEPTRYTIHHEVKPETDGPTLFSALYKFRFQFPPDSTAAQNQRGPAIAPVIASTDDNIEFPFEYLVSMTNDNSSFVGVMPQDESTPHFYEDYSNASKMDNWNMQIVPMATSYETYHFENTNDNLLSTPFGLFP